MLNKELLMIGGADSEATVVLKITHITGDQDTVEMFVQYQDPPYTGFQLLPPIPRYKTAAYTIKVPKGMRIQVGGWYERFESRKGHTERCNRRLQRRPLSSRTLQNIGQLCSRGGCRHLLTSQEALCAE